MPHAVRLLRGNVEPSLPAPPSGERPEGIAEEGAPEAGDPTRAGRRLDPRERSEPAAGSQMAGQGSLPSTRAKNACATPRAHRNLEDAFLA